MRPQLVVPLMPKLANFIGCPRCWSRLSSQLGGCKIAPHWRASRYRKLRAWAMPKARWPANHWNRTRGWFDGNGDLPGKGWGLRRVIPAPNENFQALTLILPPIPGPTLASEGEPASNRVRTVAFSASRFDFNSL